MIARHDGAIVFVAGAIPGEVVEAEIEKVQRGTAWAVTRRVLEPSPDRVDGAPDGACGGSVFAHIAYERQRHLKSAIIEDGFRRIGKVALDAPVEVVASPVDGYRMRSRLHVRNGRMGFFREGSHSLCDAASTRQLRGDAGILRQPGKRDARADDERPLAPLDRVETLHFTELDQKRRPFDPAAHVRQQVGAASERARPRGGKQRQRLRDAGRARQFERGHGGVHQASRRAAPREA